MLPQNFGALTSEDVEEAIDKDYIVILPVGTIEQHGPSLPVYTDAYFAKKWCEEATSIARKEYNISAIVVPPVFYGQSIRHSEFPGTLSLTSETFKMVINDILKALIYQGFKKIAVVNVHGGNYSILLNLLQNINLECSRQGTNVKLDFIDDSHEDILPEEFWEKAYQKCQEAKAGKMLHGGALEVSKMLSINPEVVKKERANEVFQLSSDPNSRIHIWHELTPSGAIGDPKKSNKEIGDLLWGYLIQGLVNRLKVLDKK